MNIIDKRIKMNKQRKEIELVGFVQVEGFNDLLINDQGEVYHIKTDRFLKPNKKNLIKPRNKYINVPKLLLKAFNNETYRPGQIIYRDGNIRNISINNVRYARMFPNDYEVKLDTERLKLAIRCYFEIDQDFDIRDAEKTRLYLKSIHEQRNFKANHEDKQYYHLYADYVENRLKIAQISKKYNINQRDTRIIVNSFINMLSIQVLSDLETGELSMFDYSIESRISNSLKIYNKLRVKLGFKYKKFNLNIKTSEQQLEAWEKTKLVLRKR